MTDPNELLRVISESGLQPVTDDVAQKLAAFIDLLLKWNLHTNLTSSSDPMLIFRSHLLDSLACAQHIPSEASSLLDFGSGAGFPGIPLSILRPELRVTLGESQTRRAVFLREAVRTLRLSAAVFQGRIESMLPDLQFDVITMRAVDRLETMIRCALTKLRPDGSIVVFATAATVARLSSSSGEITWGEAIRLPYSTQKILLIGRIGMGM